MREQAVLGGTDGGEGLCIFGAYPSGDLGGDIIEVSVGTVCLIATYVIGRDGWRIISYRQLDHGAGVVVEKGNFISR